MSGLTSRVLAEPGHYSFFQAVKLLLAESPDAPQPGESGPFSHEKVRFRVSPRLAFPSGDVEGVERVQEVGKEDRYEVVATFMGLHGASSPLPSHMIEAVWEGLPDDTVLRDFFDIFHHRLLSLLVKISSRYRDFHQSTPMISSMARASGIPDDGLGGLHPLELLPLAGLLQHHPRNAGGLQALLSALLPAGIAVEILQGLPRTVTLDADQRSSLGLKSCTLGVNALVGSRLLDPAGKIRVRLVLPEGSSPHPWLEGEERWRQMQGLVSAWSPSPLDADLEVVVDRARMPSAVLATRPPQSRLGQDAWLGLPPSPRPSIVVPLPIGGLL